MAATLNNSLVSAVSPICSGQNSLVTFSGAATNGATTSSSLSYTVDGGSTKTINLNSSGNNTLNTPNLTANSTYTLTGATSTTNGHTCSASFNQSSTVVVRQLPTVAAITPTEGNGKAYVQVNNNLQLSDATTGGSWSTSNGSLASIDGSGKVTGNAAGAPTISYTTAQDGNGCQNTATATVQVYNPDYVNITASNNFTNNANWQINRGDGTYTTTGVTAPSASNTGYTSITVQQPLNMDVDFQLPSGKSFNITGSGTMAILPNITFSSNGTVAFNGNHVTVRSTKDGTGAIGYMPTPIAGAENVTVERYIPLTLTNVAGRTGRAWRLLTSPVTGMTIKDAWQEGKTWQGGPTETTTGLGTIITGQGVLGVPSSTFDYIASGGHNASILQYNPGTTTGIWQVPDVNNTTGTNALVNTQPAWLLFVRGDRTANTSTAKGTTTLRATGLLNQGPQGTQGIISVPGNQAYTLVGNPFASPISFEQIFQLSSGIAHQFFTWNSKLGVYGAYSLAVYTGNSPNPYSIVPSPFTPGTGTADANAQYIQSGEGFFVQPFTTGTDGSLVINEAAKNTDVASAGINPYRVSASTEGRLFINLNLAGSATDTAAVLADGVMARFDKSYASAIDGDDIRKQSNFNENLGIESNSTSLMVEARPEVQKTDTLQLKLWNVTRRSYQLQLKGANFAQAAAQKGLHAYLEDLYLKTKQEVSLSGSVTTIAFSVTGDALSYDSHRFRVVFESDAATVLPITLTSVKAQLQNSGVSVSWSTQNEVNVRKYTVERSVNGGSTFSGIATATAKNLGATQPLSSYETFDAAPVKGDNLYRIRVEGVDGKVTYTGVVKVTVEKTQRASSSLRSIPTR